MAVIGDLFSRKPDFSGMKERKDYQGLIKSLRHQDLDIQWQASGALATFGSEGVDHLLAALDSLNKDIRLGTIEALGEIRDWRAVDPLISLLGDSDNEIRWEAALALGEIGDPRAVKSLRELLRDRDRYVRYGAAVALEKLDWTPVDSEEYSFFLAGKQEWGALSAMGIPAIPALSLASADLEKNVRINAIRTLGKTGDEKEQWRRSLLSS